MAAQKDKCTLDLNTPTEQVKRKRGRPRKSEAAGNMSQGSALASVPVPSLPLLSVVASMPMRGVVVSQSVPRVVSKAPPAFDLFHSAETSGQGRDRGRSEDLENLQMLASIGEILADSAAAAFRAHVVQINPGEDVTAKIMSLVQNRPRVICVIAANGTVFNPVISDPGSSGGVNIYEGPFQILSLTGSYTVTETGMGRCKIGGLSVSLAGADGRVMGGGVAGPLIAAGMVQIVVGSFIPDINIVADGRPGPSR